MGCGCGQSAVNPYATSMYSASTLASNPYVYEVTYPTGRTEEFAYEADAYRAIRLTGGGVKRKPKG